MIIAIQLKGFGADIHCVNVDSDGMSSQHLQQILSDWPVTKTKPKVLYTIPNGSNPTGASLSLKRKKEIYQVHELSQI